MKKNQCNLHNDFKYFEAMLGFFNKWHRPFGHTLVDITRKWHWKYFCFLYNAVIEYPEVEEVMEFETKIDCKENFTYRINYHATNGRTYTNKLVYGTGEFNYNSITCGDLNIGKHYQSSEVQL